MKPKSRSGDRTPQLSLRKDRRRLSQRQREDRQRRLVVGLVAGTLIFALGVLLLGYWREILRQGDQPILSVRGQVVSTDLFARYLGYRVVMLEREADRLVEVIVGAETDSIEGETAQLQLQLLQQRRQTLDGEALQGLVEAELLRAEAKRLGILATSEELDNALLHELSTFPAYGQPSVDATTQYAGDLTLDEARAALESVLERGRLLTEEEHRRLVLEAGVFRAKLLSELGKQVPDLQEQVRARKIRVDTEEEAIDVLARLETGEDFAMLAQELSTDISTSDSGGDLGWFPRGIVDYTVEGVAFELQPGQVSAPVEGSFGYYVVKVEDGADDRPLSPEHLRLLRSRSYDEWLYSQMASGAGTIDYFITPEKLEWAWEYVARETGSGA